MGIELNLDNRFDARCDGCDALKELGSTVVQTATVQLRMFGWKRDDYVEKVGYTWLCPKCKVLNVTQQLSS